MSRFARFAGTAALAMSAIASAHTPALAGDLQPAAFMTWPGKSATSMPKAGPAPAVALSRQFFTPGSDMAAPPPPLPPRSLPGSQAATASDNTASNRARENELLTADSAADGPTGGAEDGN